MNTTNWRLTRDAHPADTVRLTTGSAMRTLLWMRSHCTPLSGDGSSRSCSAGAGNTLSPTITSAATQSAVICSVESALTGTVMSSG